MVVHSKRAAQYQVFTTSQKELDKGYITADIHTFLVVLYVYLETLHLQGVFWCSANQKENRQVIIT